MTELSKQLAKVWYNPNVRGYELFDKNCIAISHQLEASVTINDNWRDTKDGLVTCSITLLVEIVNEQPKPQ